MKLLLLLIVALSSTITWGQAKQAQSKEAILGTFQIMVISKAAHLTSITLSSEDLMKIESRRENEEDVIFELDGFLIHVMSKKSMNEGQHWPKYQVKSKSL
ncbi:MAG: hypothetical protein JKY09_00715 [Crocinitomicaceae bacterium]|nr:hypothetical protein [Crocinitomicaceae bacterium]